MSDNRRIFLNIVATYGRSLYVLFLGIFTARWALNALGQVDYGLLGLVGGLAGFVSFLNGLLSFSVGRFYAVCVGGRKIDLTSVEALEECRKWFNTALFIHTVVPIVLLVSCYPIGEWVVRGFLAIPGERVEECVWVWRFTCLSCFVGMITVPFSAMYGAKQDIAELTIYGFCTATLNAAFLYYMITHPGVWLYRYALWGCLINISPAIIQSLRAFYKYPECRFNRHYLCDKLRIAQIVFFGAARFWTMLSSLVSTQGNAILVNKLLGPVFNASMSLGNTVVSHASTLSNSLTGAFSPAIMNAAGAGDGERVQRLAFQVCRFSAILVLIFALPLALEANQVLVLWLKTPPPYVEELILAILLDSTLEHMSEGLYMPIMAYGTGVARYSWWVGWCGLSRFFFAVLFFEMGLGMSSICIALVLARCLVIVVRLYMGRILAGMSPVYWTKHTLLPILASSLITLMLGCATKLMQPSFFRVVVTTIVCELVFLPSVWFGIMDRKERFFVISKVRTFLRHGQGGQAC